MEQKQFEEKLTNLTKKCEEIVSRFLPAEEGEAKRVIEAMNYSVSAGGKRLRPMLIMLTAQMYDAPQTMYEPFMAALEMIHTYSLIHDDLPAMDNDRFRRGRETTWAVYGDGMAVIAGDGLLNFAYETSALAFDAANAPEDVQKIIRAQRLLMKNAGIYGMVGGQCADLEAERLSEEVEKKSLKERSLLLSYIHRNKTAALIDSGLVIGAILGGAPEEDIEKLHRIAELTGIAFQVQDDILDVTGSQEELGKSIGKDAEEGKLTYVSLYGLEGAMQKREELTQEALELLQSLSRKDEFLVALIGSLITRSK